MTRLICLTAVIGATLFGCAHQQEVQPLGAVELTSASAEIERSPKAFYDRRAVYLFKGRWYYKEGDQWLTYGDEPAQLRERREAIEGAAERREHTDPYEKYDEDDMFNRR